MRWKQQGARSAESQGSQPRITLIGKPGCHLCDDARAVVGRVAGELDLDWLELDIEQDAALAERYWEKIPVVLVDGKPHDFWRVDERRLRAAVGG
jgi:Glutaredoxin-like domain (DUF836)